MDELLKYPFWRNLFVSILPFSIAVDLHSQVLGCDGKPFDHAISYGVYRMAFKEFGDLNPKGGDSLAWHSTFARYGANDMPRAGIITEVRLEYFKFVYSRPDPYSSPVFICIEVDGEEKYFELCGTFKEGNYYRLPLGAGIKFCKSMSISIALMKGSLKGVVPYKNAFAAWRTEQ